MSATHERTDIGSRTRAGLARLAGPWWVFLLTGTATSAARLYWETGRGAKAAIKHPPPHLRPDRSRRPIRPADPPPHSRIGPGGNRQTLAVTALGG